MEKKKLFHEKIKEAVTSVMPIVVIVSILAFLAAPVSTDIMLSFFVGSVLLILGLGLFMYGSDNSMVVIGNHLGSFLTRSRKLGLIFQAECI
ncbi:MAG TPA: hypothetical protein DCM49_03675 [Lachnospiraceae bacterium]|nr:hypothetical protein [Lachnospiraceae bacterium]